ncbi:MAG: response regulator transcription factor [Eubacteriales bacterium]|nr:response regulator transcription factor [Eubacteriales bacterium]
MQNILVVEDDHDLNQAICYSLKKSGYGVYGVAFMEKAKRIFVENRIDMVLLDVNLPDGEGFSFCRWVKEQKEIPVIYLTARDMEEDALAGYESGAEDYVTKPFSMKILLRKIDVILKRTASVNGTIFTDEHLYIDLDNAKMTVKGRECPITPTECRLLRLLLMNRGQLLTYDLLLERLWDCGGQFVDRHALAVNVNRLRGKMEDEHHRYISNVYGMGYQWIG